MYGVWYLLSSDDQDNVDEVEDADKDDGRFRRLWEGEPMT